MSTRSQEAPADLRTRSRRWAHGAADALRTRRGMALPALAALAVLLVLGRATDLVSAMQANADFAAPLVMGEIAHRYPGSALVAGNYGWWPGLWIVQLLRPLPGNSLLASYLPLALHGAVVGALAWRARRLFGDASAAAVVVLGMLPSAEALTHASAWSARGTSWAAVVALGLVVSAGPGRRAREGGTVSRREATTAELDAPESRATGHGARARRAPAALRRGAPGVVVALLAGVAVCGDTLGLLIALGGLGLALLAALRRGRWAAGGWIAVLALLLLGAALGAAALAADAGYAKVDLPLPLRGPETVPNGIGGSVGALTEVWRAGAGAPRPLQWLGVAAGVLAAVLVLVGLATAVGRLARTRREEETAPRDAWAGYWAGAALVALAAFAATTQSQPAGVLVSRYLFVMPLVGGALVAPLLAGRSTHAGAATVAVGAFGLAAMAGLATLPLRPVPERAPDPIGRLELREAVLSRTAALGIRKGYTAYWPSYPLTLASGFRTVALPVGQCTATSTDRLCPMYLHVAPAAYRPEPGVRTFLLVDPGTTAPDARTVVRALPAGAQPSGRYDVGEGATLYTFDYDVARDFGPG